MKTDTDVIIVGAGFTGLYAVHKFRDELGLRVQGFDGSSDVGGTWFWNRYPGARCDFPSVHYSFSFSPELNREWQWSEKYASQPEILRYLQWSADKLDTRRSFRFNTRVLSMVWDDDAAVWTVTTDDGQVTTARFIVAGVGNVTIPKENEFPGEETFQGEVYRTCRWPHQPVDFTGKRVGVIGTGSTAIQLIPEVAKEAAHLTVFQRTPIYATPLRNKPLTAEESRQQSENWEETRAPERKSFAGVPLGEERARPSALADSPEQRKEVYDRGTANGGFHLLMETYQDLMYNMDSNETICDYIRDHIRSRVNDPETAELLCPKDHPYGSKRAPFETDYYETYNRDNVTLVDVKSAAIEAITENGVRTAAEEYELDVIIIATGFDPWTAALEKLNIRGRDGLKLEDHWKYGPKTYLGLMMNGFPNFFAITGPQSATALYNIPLASEDHVDYSGDAVKRVLDTGARTIEPTSESEVVWNTLVEGVLNATVIPKSPNTWYIGANIPGKPRAAYIFPSGAPLYRAICQDVWDSGYGGFAFDGEAKPLPPMVRVDPAIAVVLGAMIMQGVKPMEECTVEEIRGLVGGLTALQAPRRDVTVEEVTYPSPSGRALPARIYKPEADGPLPVVVFFHPGGWVSGDLEGSDEPCRMLADELQAIVVSADYRLAPEEPFPAATDDTYAALCWTAEVIAEHGGDPDRLVVMGESAGALLAAVAALRARDEGGPRLAAQVLVYPAIDPQADTASRIECARGPFLSAAATDMMWAAYLGDEVTGSSPLASPVRAESLAGLAPALVISNELDPTRDEGEDYGRALADAGVDVEVRRIAGMIHGAFNFSGFVPRTREYHEAITVFLDKRLAPVTVS
jgi:cation diffusion facilitator CzcD-associated flavoprotein CzcO/acetyl esterase/lipase